MARITVEDCLSKVPNRFKLVVMASRRARQLEMGAADASVDGENDKPTVVALREIANGSVDADILQVRESKLYEPMPALVDVTADSQVQE